MDIMMNSQKASRKLKQGWWFYPQNSQVWGIQGVHQIASTDLQFRISFGNQFVFNLKPMCTLQEFNIPSEKIRSWKETIARTL